MAPQWLYWNKEMFYRIGDRLTRPSEAVSMWRTQRPTERHISVQRTTGRVVGCTATHWQPFLFDCTATHWQSNTVQSDLTQRCPGGLSDPLSVFHPVQRPTGRNSDCTATHWQFTSYSCTATHWQLLFHCTATHRQ